MCSSQNLTVFIIIIFFANTEIAIFLLFSFICQLLILPFFFKNFLICIQYGFICLLAAVGVCCFAWAFHWWLLLWSMGSRSTAFRLVGSRVSYLGSCGLWVWGIFPDQGLNPCSLCWQVDYHSLSLQESPYFTLG